MAPSRQREEVLNAKLGNLLIARHPRWDESNVHIDSTGVIRENRALKVDVLITNPGGQPVAVEAKFDAPGAEGLVTEQVEGRIGLTVDSTGDPIESGVSLLLPKGLTASRLEGAELRYAIHQLNVASAIERWPKRGGEWMRGSVDELADAVETVSLSERRIREGGQLLADGVRDAGAALDASAVGTEAMDRVAEALHQEPGAQTTRMATAIIVNAFIFHHAIEGQRGIPYVKEGQGPRGYLKSRVVRCWDRILKVNYWPVFSIARSVLDPLPARLANGLLGRAGEVAANLVDVGASTFHDLAARMFQTLITDRKLLGTFYTLPASASLLADLAISKLPVDWSDPEAVKSLRVADFACGTGALLAAAQRAMYRRVRRAGLDDAVLHHSFMEKVLLGTDIMPSAAHLTASMLSSAHPSARYEQSLVRVLPYGLDGKLSESRGLPADTAYIGALDLRFGDVAHGLFESSGLNRGDDFGGRGMSPTGSAEDGGGGFNVEQASFDLVIMNPPFPRSTNHEAEKADIPVPAFAGFGTSTAEQDAMAEKLKRHEKLFGHGNAGLASHFMDLAHEKVRKGGVLALVLPLTFAAGRSWERARGALERFYDDVTVASMAVSGSQDRAFSADTSMAECLVVATRTEKGIGAAKATARFVSLRRRPKTAMEAHEVARAIQLGRIGVAGTFADTGAVGVLEAEVADTLVGLRGGRLRLPRQARSIDFPIVKLAKIAGRGLLHRDINGKDGRGAFDVEPWDGRGAPTYPALWSHRADTERRLIVEPKSRGKVRPGMRDQAAATWGATASRLHYNQDFRLNSQSLGACLTPLPCIGGPAWPNLLPRNEPCERPLLLWLNTTLGLMLHWWSGSRQQQGRSRLSISAVPDLPVFDVASLSATQRQRLERTFVDFSEHEFLPANEAYRDPVRKALDEAVLFGALGYPDSLKDGLNLLRLQWCSEPSVHGGKSTRPGA